MKIETLSSDKSWKFTGKLKAAVNLSLLHIHFSQGLLYVVLGYVTTHSASNRLINIGREVILYLQGNSPSARCYTPGEAEAGRPCFLWLLGKVNSTDPQRPKRLPFGSAFWFPFPLSRPLNRQKLNTGRSSNKTLSPQCSNTLSMFAHFTLKHC